MSNPHSIAFDVVPADVYFFLKPHIDSTIKSKIISMEVLYNDENSALVDRTINWKKHAVSSAEIAISSVKVPIALEDRGSKWTFIVVLTYYDDATQKYITVYSERSPLVGLIKAPPVVVLSDIDNDTNRSTSLEDSFSILATFEADSLDSIDAIHLVLYDDSDELGKFRKIIFNKKELTEEFYLEGDNATAYTPVKNLEGKYEVRLLIGNLDLNYIYEIAAVTLFQMLFSDVSNTILFSPDKVPFLKKLVDKKTDIKVNFDYANGNAEVYFNLFSPGVPAEDEQNEKLVVYVERYPTAARIEEDKIGTAEISLLFDGQDTGLEMDFAFPKNFAFYDNNRRNTGNLISFYLSNLLKDDSSQLVEIGEINYLRIFVENSYGKSKRYYDIEFQLIKKEEAHVLQISEIVADSKAIKIRWTPPDIRYNNEISTWKVTRSEDTTAAERQTNPFVLTKIIETIDVANTDENKENGDLVYTFNSLEVDKKFTFQVSPVITNQFNFDTWSTNYQSTVTSTTIPGNQSNESYGVAYDTYPATTATARTDETYSDGQCQLDVTVPTKPNFIHIDSIETEYTGDDGSSGTQSTVYNPNGTTVVIQGLSNSVAYSFQVYVKASLAAEALSNFVSTQTNGTKSTAVSFRPWRSPDFEVEFDSIDNTSGSFVLKFLRQINAGSNNSNISSFISNGTLKLEWRQPYSTNEFTSDFVEFTPQQLLRLSDANIFPGLLTFVKGILSFLNPNNSTQSISIDSNETACVKPDAYAPSNLLLEPDTQTGSYGSADITWENPVFEDSSLYNSADNLSEANLVGFEVKLYSSEDLDFISLPSTTGYRLFTNISDNLSGTSRSFITPLNAAIVGGQANPTAMTPAISALGYDGWYYKKTLNDSVNNKINWYLVPEITTKVSDLSQMFFKLKLINKESLPYIIVYTKPTGTGDAAVWYKSRRMYEILDRNDLVNSDNNYCCYMNFNSNTNIPVSEGHISVALSNNNVVSFNRGALEGTEDIQFVAFSTSSPAPVNTVEFIFKSLCVQSSTATQTYLFSNIISGLIQKDIETTGKVYQYKYNYSEAQLGKTLRFMVEAIYPNSVAEIRAPAIGTILAYKLPDAPTINSVTSVNLTTLDIEITPPTQLGGGSLYGYLVQLVGTDNNGVDVPTSDRTILNQNLVDGNILRIDGLTSNVQYVASVKTLIDLTTPSGANIQSELSLPGPARYCLHSVAQLEIKNFRINKNGYNISDSIVANQDGAIAELKWDSIEAGDGGYALDYCISYVDAEDNKLSADTIVTSSAAKVLTGLKFISGLSYFKIIARIPNLNTDDATDLITGAASRTSGRLYDTITEAVQNLRVVAGDQNVVVNWDLITQSTRGTNVAKYRVCFYEQNGTLQINNSNFYVEVENTVTTATVSNLTNGVLYNFAVLYSLIEAPETFFVSDNGYLLVAAIPFAAPSACTISADINVGIKQARITVTTESTANGSDIFKYNLYRKNITTNESSFTLLGSFTKVNDVLAYTDSNVAVGSRYDYFVKAVCKDTNNDSDFEGAQSNTVRKIIFVKFATPSQLLTFQNISENDFTTIFKSLKDELAIASNSISSTGFVSRSEYVLFFGTRQIIDARLKITCSYLNPQDVSGTTTVTKFYTNSFFGDSTTQLKLSDLRGATAFPSGNTCTLTVSIEGKNPNNNEYVATDSLPVLFQPFGKATFNSFKTYNGTNNVTVKVIADPATTNYNFGVFSTFKCKVYVGYNGLFNNNGYSGIASADLTSATGLFTYAIKNSDLSNSNPNRQFKFVITMETSGNYPSTNKQISNEVNVIVISESISSPDPVTVVKESFYYSQDQTKAYVKVNTNFAPLVSLIVIFKIQSINNSSNTELYNDSRYPVTHNGITYQIRDISSDLENLEDKNCGIFTYEIPLIGFTSPSVIDFILLAATSNGLSRPYFVSTKSNNTLAFGKAQSVYFPPDTNLDSIVQLLL